MNSLLYSVAGFVVAIGILVAVHEYGHYKVARLLGVKVLKFSIGFGRPIWSRTAGPDGTEYAIGMVPLGGYVKMLDEGEGDVDPADAPRAFNRQSLPRRTAIVLAGPMANFAFAVVAYLAVMLIGVDGLRPVVGDVRENTPAAEAGFLAGDEIVRIDGRANQTWSEHRMYLFYRALRGATVEFDVLGEDGVMRPIVLDLGTVAPGDIDAGLIERVVGLLPFVPEPDAMVGTVIADSPAQRAGVQAGDRIVRIGPWAVTSWRDLVEIVSERPDETLSVVVDRDGVLLTLEMTTQAHTVGDRQIGRIGIAPPPMEIPQELLVQARYGPLDLLVRSVETTWVTTALTVTMLYKMVKLEVSSKNISGPITIAHYAGTTARIGLDQFLLFLAVVSISLGIINLLPIPMLDGGHLLYYVAEAVKGSPVSEQTMIRGQQIGIVMLVGLMGLAFYNDIVRLFQ